MHAHTHRVVPGFIEQLVGDADAFPILRQHNHFDHAGCSPLPARGRDALLDFTQHFARHAYVGFDFMAPLDRLRASAAAALGADRDEIAIVHNTSEGVSQVARGLPWQRGDRIVTAQGEYPANIYPWMDLARRFGVELIRVPERHEEGRVFVSEQEILDAADHPRARLIALSHVQWATGQRMDIEQIGRFCRERGVLLSVDAIQSMGVIPLDVRELNIDFLQAGGHKWMLGTMGAGILYVRRELIEQVHPATIGWASVAEPFDWDRVEYTLREGALRYEYGVPPLPSVIALEAGLSLLLEAGIEGVFRRVFELTGRFVAGIEEAGWRVVTRREGGADACSGAVSLLPPEGGAEEAKRLMETLAAEHKTQLALRGGRLRFSPHFYNTDEQIDRLIDRLTCLI